MIALIEQHHQDLIELCKQYRVQRLDLFGSAAKGTFKTESSDLDFIARFADTTSTDYADRYICFAESLESLFRRPVDLLTERMVGQAEFRIAVEPTRQIVYEQRS